MKVLILSSDFIVNTPHGAMFGYFFHIEIILRFTSNFFCGYPGYLMAYP